jgi:hypothetical protein
VLRPALVNLLVASAGTMLFCSSAVRASERSTTFYVAKISSERTWQHVIKDPFGADYVESHLLVAALSRPYARFRDDALQLEAEGQLAYHFGLQDHFEINAVPVMARWKQFPWSEYVDTSVAYGLGLSYSTDLPEVEVALEGESRRTLIYWTLEFTAGPPTAAWAVSLRLHHRSVAWGLFGEDGGMNAIGIGVRYRFGSGT